MIEKLKCEAPRKTMALLLTLAIALGPTVLPAFAATKKASAPATATPIQHLVVIFQENISFDHYFGTYPVATNPTGEPKFKAAPNTPAVNGLTNALANFNPNLNPANGAGASNPFRLDRSQAVTPDQNHDYTAEQLAFDAGLLDLFPLNTSSGGNEVMGYFDGNTVTAMWNYAQFFAMSDNSYSTTFGPSTPGLINLVSGQTNGVTATLNGTGDEVSGGSDGSLTVVGDPDPIGDVCSNPTRNQVTMANKNAGYSDPLDEQTFLVSTVNFLETLPTWSNTAVVIMYDDSDGWYDHQMGPIVNTSAGSADALTAPGFCGSGANSLPGFNAANLHAQGRCGYGMRQPLLVISPWAKKNFVDHSLTDQTSIIRFIEDNWLGGTRIGTGSFDAIANSITQMFDLTRSRSGANGVLFLNPSTGQRE